MDRPSDSQKPRSSASSPKNSYLIAYNTLSACLWSIVLSRTILLTCTAGPERIYPTIGDFVKWTQTLAGLEILHSLIGIVRTPVLTTLMQVASRFLLVWGIVDQFPNLVMKTEIGPWAYASMLLAWSFTEVVRYTFFAMQLGSSVPGWLKWLRYNTFFVLYPLGIGSECVLVYLTATGPAKTVEVGGVGVAYGLWAVLAVYVPGEFALMCTMWWSDWKLMVLRELHSVYAYDGTEEESAEGWWGEEEVMMLERCTVEVTAYTVPGMKPFVYRQTQCTEAADSELCPYHKLPVR
jgi:very-long-chain (3R)-3-hydroxyacyl-CoA dehydratase